MKYVIEWRDKEITVDNGAEAVAALEQIAADPNGPFLMHVAPPDRNDPMIQMVYGRADRAMLTYTDSDFGGHAVDPDLPIAPSDLDYDYGSVEPQLTRVTAAQARRAVAELVETGRRPTCVSWVEPEALS